MIISVKEVHKGSMSGSAPTDAIAPNVFERWINNLNTHKDG